VHVREKDLPAAELAELCRRLLGVTAPSGALLIVNDRLDVALAVGAEAVQRTHRSLTIRDMRRASKIQVLVGASTHSVEESIEAEAAGADWVTFGPVYDTPAKRAYGPPQGLASLEKVARAVRIPVVAIGGITPERVPEVRAAGAHGVAVISAILGVDSPRTATRRFLEALDRAA
jgi:thiamine-phosphate pyrophosphorylase